MILLPWPNHKLSSNARYDLRALTAIRRQAKQDGYYAALEAGLSLPAAQLEMRWKFYPPDRRQRDDDNLLTSCKPFRDGIFLALKLDDHLVRRTVIEWGPVCKGGKVEVEIGELSCKLNGLQ